LVDDEIDHPHSSGISDAAITLSFRADDRRRRAAALAATRSEAQAMSTKSAGGRGPSPRRPGFSGLAPGSSGDCIAGILALSDFLLTQPAPKLSL
jgi:hypothetical protein